LCFYRELTDLEYEEICESTLHSITEKFEELAETDAIGEDFDVSFSVGLFLYLTVTNWFSLLLHVDILPVNNCSVSLSVTVLVNIVYIYT